MNNNKPVIVDLDGSLIHTDTLLESFMALMKANPLWVLLVPFWLLKGKANLKNRIAEKVDLDVALLPYNPAVVDYVRSLHESGVPCYLATGTVKKYAEAIADHLGIFTGVYATDDQTNLTGSNKARLMNELYGEGGYSYIGNHSVDLKLWKHSAKAVVVSQSQSLVNKAKAVCSDVEQLDAPVATLKTYLKAIRVHQWVKNALILVPLLTSHQWTNPDLILISLLGLLAYSLAASSVYVLNDLVDLESDRQHPSKCKRPFAAGVIPVTHGLLLFPGLLVAAFGLALLLPMQFLIALFVYYVLTVAYSFKFKRIIMLDTILLALLYTMRIIAGTVLIGVDFSFWLLAFSMFIFLSLALVKRYTELVLMQESGAKKTIGRGYHAEDASMVSGLGAASGYIAVLVLALYVNSPDVVGMYQQPALLWLTCPVMLYWISRVWILAHRGEMHDDPIVFAVKDLQSLVTAACIGAVFVAASLGLGV